ncbi:MAG: IS66 family transposase [Ardenticatenaceae bacterium]
MARQVLRLHSTVEENTHKESETKKKKENTPTQEQEQKNESIPTQKQTKKVEKKKPGKQVGAEGHGRQVEMEVTAVESHRACECAACGESLTEESPFFARGGLYVLDIEVQEFGIKVTHIKHLYGDTHCECGHITQTKPGRCSECEGWEVELSQWHLVGPTLASLIICLALRMRLSRRRIQEFLYDWLSIKLSVGVINQTITEGGRASSLKCEQLIEEIRQSELLHADETGWKENGRLVWLWVLVTVNTTLFLIGSRSWDVIADALDGFAGWLMSDGYRTYRRYAKRLRCLAHLIRKARGLAESLDREAQLFGETILSYFSIFIKGIYQARAGAEVDLKEKFADELANLKEWCSLKVQP